MRVMVTGGSGFVGSALIRFLLRETSHDIINVDNLSHSSGKGLESVGNNTRYFFEKVNVSSQKGMDSLLDRYEPHIIYHLAAETNVDASIRSPRIFLQTNIYGAFVLLESSRKYLAARKPSQFRIIFCSTDEVYGSLGEKGVFKETSAYQPNSPYAASKAAAEMMMRAWSSSYDLPTITTHCSNNYGPYQNDNKFIPKVIKCALNNEPVPIYGDGKQVRDWIHVNDHCRALWFAALHGKPGQAYNLGGNESWTNNQLARMVCRLLDEMAPTLHEHESLIQYIDDRPGHDRRSAVDFKKAYNELIWLPQIKLMVGLREVVAWYVRKAFADSGIKA